MKFRLRGLGCFVVIVVFCLALVLIAAMVLKGGMWLTEKAFPVIFIFFQCSVIVTVCLMFLSLFRFSRGFAAKGLMWTSSVSGLTLWIWSLLITFELGGWFYLVLGLFLLGVGVVPLAFIAVILKGLWMTLGELFVLLVLTGVARYLGRRILISRQRFSQFIDADYVVKD